MHELVAADDIIRRQRIVVPLDARHDAARLAHHDLAGCDVPLGIHPPVSRLKIRDLKRGVKRVDIVPQIWRSTPLENLHLPESRISLVQS